MFPLVFNPFNDALDTDHEVKMALITPRAIPVNFFGSGKTSIQTYEFYNPSALARQLAFGQLPIALCYADAIKPREAITSLLEWIRVAQLPSSVQAMVVRMEGTSVLQIGSHISRHDRPRVRSSR